VISNSVGFRGSGEGAPYSNLKFFKSPSYKTRRGIVHFVRLRNDLYCVEWGVKLYSPPLLHATVLPYGVMKE